MQISPFAGKPAEPSMLVIDKTVADWLISIATTDLALAAYPVAIEREFMPRAAAIERTLTKLCFFWNSPQGPETEAIGYQDFYYHFLDNRIGRCFGWLRIQYGCVCGPPADYTARIRLYRDGVSIPLEDIRILW